MTYDRALAKERLAAKNQARKNGRSNGNGTQRREARALRRVTKGKFGHMLAGHFNERLPGTTGTMRKLRKEDEQ